MHLQRGHLWIDNRHHDFSNISDIDLLSSCSSGPKNVAPARRCNRTSPIQSLPARVGAALQEKKTCNDRSRPRLNREQLCYCTEELGSESSSCIGNYTLINHDSLIKPSFTPPMQIMRQELDVAIIKVDNPAREKVSDVGLGELDGSLLRSRLSAVGRTYPPPISSLLSDRPLMKSFKSNGRFVLKRVGNASRSMLSATRKDGRLRLDLISPVDDPETLSFPATSSSVTDILQEIKV